MLFYSKQLKYNCIYCRITISLNMNHHGVLRYWEINLPLSLTNFQFCGHCKLAHDYISLLNASLIYIYTYHWHTEIRAHKGIRLASILQV